MVTPREEAMGRHYAFMVPETDRVALSAVAEALMQQRGGARSTNRNTTRDGRTIFCEWFSTPLVGPAGQTVGVASLVLDVTDRQQTEAAMRESEERHHAILQAAMDGFWEADMQGRLLEVNQAYCGMSGYSEQELLTMHIADLETVERFDDVATHNRKIIAQETDRFESRHRRKDGSTFDVEVRAQYRRAEGGRFVAFLHDITARKRMEEDLHREREFEQALMDNIADGVVACDANGKLVLFNRAAREWHGVDALAITHEEWGRHHELYGPDGTTPIPIESSPLVRALHGETVRDTKMTIIAKGQAPRHVIASGRRIFDARHDLLGAVLVVHDITDRRAAEEALKQSEELLSLFMRHSPIHTYIKSVTPTESRVLQASESFKQMIGTPSDDMVGKTMAELFPAEFAEKISADDWAVVASGKVLRTEEELNGRHYTTIKFPIVQESRTLLAGYTIDITERRAAEEALRQSEELLSTFLRYSPIQTYIKAVTPTESRFLMVGDSYKEAHGVSDVEVVGKTMAQLFSPEFAAKITADDWSVVSTGKVLTVDTDVNGRNYTTIKFPIVQGSKTLLAGYTVDITERKQAEMRLAQSHELLANLTRMVPGVIYQCRLYPDGRSAFPYCSPRMSTNCEVTPEELREDAAPFFERLHPDDRDRVREAMLESARTLQTLQCEFRVILPQQGLRWRWTEAYPERAEDGGTLWYGTMQGITKRKMMEDALRVAKEAAEAATQVKDQFLAKLSHELRTPLTPGAVGGGSLADAPGSSGRAA